MSLITRLLLFVLVAVGLAHGVPARAQAGVVGAPQPVCIARAEPGMTAAALFRTPNRFDCAIRQSALGAGDFWVLSAPIDRPESVSRPIPIRYASLWQRQATLYIRYADGFVDRRVIDDVAQAGSVQLGAIIEQRTTPRGVPVRQLLWHVEGSANLRGVLVGAHVATVAESNRSNVLMAAMYAAFMGMCIALLVHNLTLWVALRHPFQIAYVGMVACLMLYGLSSSGALAWMFGGVPNTVRLRINYLMLGLSAASALQFARTFFGERVFAGWVGRLTNVAAVTVAATGVLYALAAPINVRVFDRIFAISFVPVLACVPPMLWRAWQQRSNHLWLFAAAWAAPLGFAALRLMNNLHPLGWSFWLDNSTILAMTVEALLTSVAIAYRVRLLARERDEARAEEIAARVLADTDPLTGLLNRRAFLARAIGRSDAQVLLVVDIDHFKQVNETIGHDGGDEVLRRFARALRVVVPPEALVARLGGEEFAILAPRALAPEPDDVLARLRTTRMPFDLVITASIGASTGVLESEQDWKVLYKAADRALFDAKAAGRDRSRLAIGGLAIAARPEHSKLRSGTRSYRRARNSYIGSAGLRGSANPP